jgi:hypothetical protein
MKVHAACGRIAVTFAVLALLIAAAGAVVVIVMPRGAHVGPARKRAARTFEAQFEGISLRGRGWQLEGDVAEVSRDGENVLLRPVRRASLLRDGRPQINLKCDRLALHRPSGDMVISGKVMLTTFNGLRLQTEHLRWLAEKQMLLGDAPALMRLGNVAMRVSRITYSVGDQELQCGRGVRLATRDSHVTADRLAVLVRERQVRLAGNIAGRLAVDERGEFLSRGPAAELRRLLTLPGKGT